MENCCPDYSCETTSRRKVLTALGLAAIAIPALARTARADATTVPSATDTDWLKTVKPAAIKDNSSKSITGHPVVLTRVGTTVMALSNKCTHKGCAVASAPGQTSLNCPCHRAEFDYTGKNLQGPHKPGGTADPSLPALGLYALRLSADGIIEVDTSHARTADDKETKLTITA